MVNHLTPKKRKLLEDMIEKAFGKAASKKNKDNLEFRRLRTLYRNELLELDTSITGYDIKGITYASDILSVKIEKEQDVDFDHDRVISDFKSSMKDCINRLSRRASITPKVDDYEFSLDGYCLRINPKDTSNNVARAFLPEYGNIVLTRELIEPRH